MLLVSFPWRPRDEFLNSTDYTLPDKAEDYIHRIGRVGRADRVGLAISIVGKYKEKVGQLLLCSQGAQLINTGVVPCVPKQGEKL
jgi:hypothetical protein